MELFFDLNRYKEGVRRSDRFSWIIFTIGLALAAFGLWLAAHLPQEEPVPVPFFLVLISAIFLVIAGMLKAAQRHINAAEFYGQAVECMKIDGQKMWLQTSDMTERTFNRNAYCFVPFTGHDAHGVTYWIRIQRNDGGQGKDEGEFCLGYSKEESDAVFQFLSSPPGESRHGSDSGQDFKVIPAIAKNSTVSTPANSGGEFVLRLPSFGPAKSAITQQMGAVFILASIVMCVAGFGNGIVVLIFILLMAAAIFGGFLLYWLRYKPQAATLVIAPGGLKVILPDGPVSVYPYPSHTFRHKAVYDARRVPTHYLEISGDNIYRVIRLGVHGSIDDFLSALARAI